LCDDYGDFERGDYRMRDLQELSARGKLAFMLSELAALQEKDEEDAD
jgi:hypothetical protein